MPQPQQPPVIVLPGITATTLDDYYPIEPERVWAAVRNKEYERIAMHPDDLRYEAREPARVLPANPFDLVYGDLVDALRHELSAAADNPTPVFGFGYDWRQDCTLIAGRLGEFIDEVLGRTRLLRHYRDQPPQAVDVVGHSLGGLVAARYLKQRQDAGVASRVRRVVTIATPYRGSIQAIHKLALGMSLLGGPDPKARERETARTLPSIYQLLPSFKDAIDFGPAVPANDLFDVAAWQQSILSTLHEFIRIHDGRTDEKTLLSDLLSRAKTFIDSVNALDPAAVLPEGKSGWLPIVGVDAETHVKAGITLQDGGPRFEFPGPVNRWGDKQAAVRVQTGDQTVPFLGACPDFLERGRLVCVTKDDVSFWELRDRLLVEFGGFHGLLPTLNLVQGLVACFLRDDLRWPLRARLAPGVTPAKRLWPAWLTPR